MERIRVNYITTHHSQKLTWNGLKTWTETWDHKLSEENIKESLPDIGLGNGFLDITSKTQATKVKINKWGYNKWKGFYTVKQSSKQKVSLCNGRKYSDHLIRS